MIGITRPINPVLPTKMFRHGLRSFLPEAQTNMPVSASAQAAEIRSKRRSVALALSGRQAPIRNHSGQSLVQLRTEMSRNVGTVQMRRMHMGGHNVEVLGDDTMNDMMDKVFF